MSGVTIVEISLSMFRPSWLAELCECSTFGVVQSNTALDLLLEDLFFGLQEVELTGKFLIELAGHGSEESSPGHGLFSRSVLGKMNSKQW